MRVVINGPPKQGHRWLKCLLSDVYNLEILGGNKTPDAKPQALADWIAAGGFPDNTIFHQHARFSPRLADVLDAAPAHLLTPIRDPYDAFVSFYYWAQDRAAHREFKDKPRPRDAIIGKPLDHPDVLAYLSGDYGRLLSQAATWLHSGRATPIRYEHLHGDALASLRSVTDRLGPVDDTVRLDRAVANCRSEVMRQSNAKYARHVRTATVGDSKQRLTEAHLAVFRDRYADLIRSLGYEVR